ncbi:MAG: hypothetical protein K6T88_22340 [Bacillus sp. (in: Bacteria)]|nr:hypothetical protein [Bacillus sp. (in: firmicutes)]
MIKKEDHQTTAAKKTHSEFDKGSTLPNKIVVSGESVEEHRNLEEANIINTGDEIRQQNENL